eukprot:131406-Pelagomonas_calceolata.AAC.1
MLSTAEFWGTSVLQNVLWMPALTFAVSVIAVQQDQHVRLAERGKNAESPNERNAERTHSSDRTKWQFGLCPQGAKGNKFEF